MFTILIKKINDYNKYEKLRGKSSKTVMYNRKNKTLHGQISFHQRRRPSFVEVGCSASDYLPEFISTANICHISKLNNK